MIVDRQARCCSACRWRRSWRSSALYWTVTAWFHRWTTETDVTNLRVVHKTGFIKRRTFEMALDKVESVDVNQSILGRILNYGDVTDRGRRRGRRDDQDDRLAAGVPQSHHRAIGRRAIHGHAAKFFRNRQPLRASTVDPAEIAKFSKLSDEWWDPNGKMAPLHKINPLRLTYIRDAACRKFERNVRSLNCLSGLRILDIGCGAGLLCEPFTRLGAQVIGVDPSATNIAAAKLHADKGHLSIDYRCTTVEEMDVRERFDIVLAMEVVEHVTDVGVFLNRCAAMLKPGGLMVVSTLEPQLEELCARHRRRRICPALAAARHPSMGQVRHPRRTRAASARQQARHHRAGRRGLQPVRRQMEPLVRHGRELHGGGGGGVGVTSPLRRVDCELGQGTTTTSFADA